MATGLYDDLRLVPLLRRLLTHTGQVLDVGAGAISLMEPSGERYSKRAEVGAACQLGRSFPLDQGITGQVVARRRPVVLDRYSDLLTGHLPATHPAADGAVAAVPIWWRGDVIGTNVAFAGRRRRFTAREVDELELLSQVGAAAIVAAGAADPSLAHLSRHDHRGSRDSGAPVVVTEAGPTRPLAEATAEVVADLVDLAERAVAAGPPSGPLRVAVVYRRDGLRLLAYDGRPHPGADLLVDPLGAGTRTWQERVVTAGGEVTVEQVPGWGVLVRADLPYQPTGAQAPSEPPPPVPARDHPLTPRERETLALLARGLSDRQIAEALVLSRKTVEKHVGAVLRKTGTTSRTAAVVHCLERGWLPPPAAGQDGRATGTAGSPGPPSHRDS